MAPPAARRPSRSPSERQTGLVSPLGPTRRPPPALDARHHRAPLPENQRRQRKSANLILSMRVNLNLELKSKSESKLKFDVGSESEFQCGVGSASECEHGHETKFESELYNASV